MEIELLYIDVTFRDGGHQNGFNWPMDFVKRYLTASSQCQVTPDYVELGYWKQYDKYDGTFYKIDENVLEELNKLFPEIKFSVMLDYHYCSHDLDDYPKTGSPSAPSLIRLCSRSTDINEAVEFGARLKEHCGSKLSLNFFNITNYSENDIIRAVNSAMNARADFIYFADTHGSLDLLSEKEKYAKFAKMISDAGITPGLHLHDHSGKAYTNYRALKDVGFTASDYSFCGIGKGMGNLRLEHVHAPSEVAPLLELMKELQEMVPMPNGPWGLISAQNSIADHYAVQAEKLKISPTDFQNFALNLKLEEKDVFNPNLLGN